jgi:hypothetical protein
MGSKAYTCLLLSQAAISFRHNFFALPLEMVIGKKARGAQSNEGLHSSLSGKLETVLNQFCCVQYSSESHSIQDHKLHRRIGGCASIHSEMEGNDK